MRNRNRRRGPYVLGLVLLFVGVSGVVGTREPQGVPVPAMPVASLIQNYLQRLNVGVIAGEALFALPRLTVRWAEARMARRTPLRALSSAPPPFAGTRELLGSYDKVRVLEVVPLDHGLTHLDPNFARLSPDAFAIPPL